ISSGVTATSLKLANAFDGPDQVAYSLLVTIAVTTIVWIAVTFLTKPESEQTLVAFYERVRPARAGWGPIAKLAAPSQESENLGIDLRDWIAGCGLVYCALFGIGKLCLGEIVSGILFFIVAAVCIYVILHDLDRRTPRFSARAVAAA